MRWRSARGTDLTARLQSHGSRRDRRCWRASSTAWWRAWRRRRSELVDQSFQAGFAELAKGVLHNLGNAMTPLGVRVAKLGERLRDAPAGDLAAGERRTRWRRIRVARASADLKEFLRLGCREIGSDRRGGAGRTSRSFSGRRHRANGTERADAIDAQRSRDRVGAPAGAGDADAGDRAGCLPTAAWRSNADESLRKVGAVRVARTVLRLVLQNLIINAADAVRDAGRAKGVLRVAAEIVRDADGEQLHLHCKDDGVGISKDNLERVFEKGFSTKSRDTNYGIGLHWCANAIAALGGRIWAASEGPGRGASMHLMLPLAVREA